MGGVETLTIEGGGKITLPEDVLARYGLAEETPVRLVRTRRGILLIPLTGEPMGPALAAELEEWQAAGTESWEAFAYEEPAP